LVALVDDDPDRYDVDTQRPIRSVGELKAVADQTGADFWARDCAAPVTNFLNNNPLVVPFEAAVRLAEVCAEALAVLMLPEELDPLDASGSKAITGKTVPIGFNYQGHVESDLTAELTLDFAALEGWWNLNRNGIAKDQTIAAIKADPVFSRLINPAEGDTGSNTKLAILNRAFRTPGYIPLQFQVNGRKYSAYDSIFQALCASLASPSQLPGCRPCIIEISPLTSDDRHPLNIPQRELPGFGPVLELLETLHRLFPSLNLVSPALAHHALSHLSSPALTIGRWSATVSLIWSYPYLFPFDLRLLFCQLTAFDVAFSLKTLYQTFIDTTDDSAFDQIRVRVTIDRARIFDDGRALFERLGPGRCHFDVAFRGEEGIGHGPTQEFFTLFGDELCSDTHGLWAHSRANGLFPRPDANTNLFHILGLLCGKALSMNCTVSIQFNPAFFDIVNGAAADPEIFDRVDHDWWTSVNCKDGLVGCDFVYFGIDSLKLTDNKTSITDDNYDVWLIKSKELFLCRPQADAFKRGFSSVIPWEATAVFTRSEIVTVLCGDLIGGFTHVDLEKHVLLERGYDRGSPEVQMLFDVLVEMGSDDRQNFLQFVTGARYLPIGGLAALRPKLTVARKVGGVDAYGLPSVMTCRNYLKLPPYATKEVLREKLVRACRDGRNSFDLT
jgi:E3 ubiquitin-protein ligase TRIP12